MWDFIRGNYVEMVLRLELLFQEHLTRQHEYVKANKLSSSGEVGAVRGRLGCWPLLLTYPHSIGMESAEY